VVPQFGVRGFFYSFNIFWLSNLKNDFVFLNALRIGRFGIESILFVVHSTITLHVYLSKIRRFQLHVKKCAIYVSVIQIVFKHSRGFYDP
jgi:hypothetical protein